MPGALPVILLVGAPDLGAVDGFALRVVLLFR